MHVGMGTHVAVRLAGRGLRFSLCSARRVFRRTSNPCVEDVRADRSVQKTWFVLLAGSHTSSVRRPASCTAFGSPAFGSRADVI